MSVRNQTDCKNTNCGMPVCEPCKCEKYKSLNDMKTEQELKDKCTKKFIDWLENLAEGFFDRQRSGESCWFPLLIHRAVEGWNKKQSGKDCIVISDDNIVFWSDNLDLCRVYDFKNYQPESLTQSECAMLDCLIEAFTETGGER